MDVGVQWGAEAARRGGAGVSVERMECVEVLHHELVCVGVARVAVGWPCAAHLAVVAVEVEVMSVHGRWWWPAWAVECGLWVVFAWTAAVARRMRMLNAHAGARSRVRVCGRVL